MDNRRPGRKCTICLHPDRESIEVAASGNVSLTHVARKYGVKRDCIARHIVNHVDMRGVMIARRNADNERQQSWVEQVTELKDEALRILHSAENPQTALQAVREAARILEMIGRATGELLPAQVQNVFVELGLSLEDAKSILLERKRLSDGYTLEHGRDDAVATLKLYLSEHPERAGELRAELFGDKEVGQCD